MKLTEKSADNKVKRWGKGGREGVSAPTLCTVSTPCAFPFNKWLYNYFIILKMWSLSCILLIHLLLLTSCSFKFILKWRGEKHISVSCIIYYLTWHFIQRNILLNHTIAFVVFLSLWPSVEKRWYSCFKCQIHYSLETWARSLTWHHLTDFVLLFYLVPSSGTYSCAISFCLTFCDCTFCSSGCRVVVLPASVVCHLLDEGI